MIELTLRSCILIWSKLQFRITLTSDSDGFDLEWCLPIPEAPGYYGADEDLRYHVLDGRRREVLRKEVDHYGFYNAPVGEQVRESGRDGEDATAIDVH